jgi:hypothetical protein
MSRYQLLAAHEVVVIDGTRRRLHAGTTIADSSGNAQAGDVIAPGLCASPNIRLVALDTAAVAAFASVGITTAIGQALSSSPTGADSIEG